MYLLVSTPFHRTPFCGPPSVRPLLRRTLRRTAQNFALFSFSRLHFRSLSLSLCVFSLNFGGFCEDRDRQMCTLEREKKRKLVLGDVKKKTAKFWLSQPSGPHPSGPHPSGSLPFGESDPLLWVVGVVVGVSVVVRVLDFGQFRLRPIRLRPAGRNRIGRSRNWPKSNRWCLFCSFFVFFSCFLFFSFFSFYLFLLPLLFLLLLLSHLLPHFLFVLFLFLHPKTFALNPKPQTPHPPQDPSAPPLPLDPQNVAFFPSPATVFNCFSLSCWSFRGILEKGSGAQPDQKQTGLSGCRVKPRRQDQQEREKRLKTEAGEGKKRREILALPPFRAPPFPSLGLHPSGPHPLWSKNLPSKNWPKSKLAEVKIGRSRKKKKLAEVEIGRSRPRTAGSTPPRFPIRVLTLNADARLPAQLVFQQPEHLEHSCWSADGMNIQEGEEARRKEKEKQRKKRKRKKKKKKKKQTNKEKKKGKKKKEKKKIKKEEKKKEGEGKTKGRKKKKRGLQGYLPSRKIEFVVRKVR